MACFLLLSMPSEYENVVTAIRTLSEDVLKMEFVKKRLLEFNINKSPGKVMKSVVASSFTAQKIIKCFKCGKVGHVRSICGIKCHTCHKFGHRSAQCYQNKSHDDKKTTANHAKNENKSGDSKGQDQNQTVAFCAVSTSAAAMSVTEWYADSGARYSSLYKQ